MKNCSIKCLHTPCNIDIFRVLNIFVKRSKLYIFLFAFFEETKLRTLFCSGKSFWEKGVNQVFGKLLSNSLSTSALIKTWRKNLNLQKGSKREKCIVIIKIWVWIFCIVKSRESQHFTRFWKFCVRRLHRRYDRNHDHIHQGKHEDCDHESSGGALALS